MEPTLILLLLKQITSLREPLFTAFITLKRNSEGRVIQLNYGLKPRKSKVTKFHVSFYFT